MEVARKALRLGEGKIPRMFLAEDAESLYLVLSLDFPEKGDCHYKYYICHFIQSKVHLRAVYRYHLF